MTHNHLNWTANGTENVTQMKVIVTNGAETHEALLEILKTDTVKFKLVIVSEVWTINFTA